MSVLSLKTCLSNLKSLALTVLELLLTGPLRARTHTQTHIERKQYLCHSLRSLGGDNDGFSALTVAWALRMTVGLYKLPLRLCLVVYIGILYKIWCGSYWNMSRNEVVCALCQGEEETSIHFIAQCNATMLLRRSILGDYMLSLDT